MSGSWGEYRYRVLTSTAVTPVIRELVLQPVDAALVYQAGQYVLLGDLVHRLPQRSYSIANAPREDGRTSLLVTYYPSGPVSHWVHHALRPGDDVLMAGPYGTFVADAAEDAPILLLAAGSGLAPIRALGEDLLARNSDRKLTLFFSARSAEHAIDRARLDEWQAMHPGFRFLLTLTRDPVAPMHRRIPELLPECFESLHGWQVFASGPSGFVTGCAAAARALGADAGAVHTEEFFADPQPWIDNPPATPQSSLSR